MQSVQSVLSKGGRLGLRVARASCQLGRSAGQSGPIRPRAAGLRSSALPAGERERERACRWPAARRWTALH